MVTVSLESPTHSLLLKIKRMKKIVDKANYTNDQIVRLGLETLLKVNNPSKAGRG